MGVTVRRSTSRLDSWDVIPGEPRWVDSSCQQGGEDLVVYIHTFRRVRERHDSTSDLLLWKPATTKIAHRYGADEWEAVDRAVQEWPPVEVERVARRPHHWAGGRNRG